MFTCFLDIAQLSPDFSKRQCKDEEGNDCSKTGDDDDGGDTDPPSGADQRVPGDGQDGLQVQQTTSCGVEGEGDQGT